MEEFVGGEEIEQWKVGLFLYEFFGGGVPKGECEEAEMDVSFQCFFDWLHEDILI